MDFYIRKTSALGIGLCLLSGCSSFNLEGSVLLSYGDNQKIKRGGGTTEITFKENKIKKDPFPLPYPLPLGAEEVTFEERPFIEEDLPVARQLPLNSKGYQEDMLVTHPEDIPPGITLPSGTSMRSRKRTITRY